jgi:hypothetical protein
MTVNYENRWLDMMDDRAGCNREEADTIPHDPFANEPDFDEKESDYVELCEKRGSDCEGDES